MRAIWRVVAKELKQLDWGQKVLNWRLALNRTVVVDWKYDEKPEWLTFTLWNKAAENFDSFVEKWHVVSLVWTLRKDNYEDEWVKKEFVKLKVSNFNYYGKSALYFDDVNEVSLEWNVTKIFDDKKVGEKYIRKNFSIAVNHSYTPEGKDEPVVSTDFWNIQMLVPSGLEETFKEHFTVWRPVSLQGMVTFYQDKNDTTQSVIKINSFSWFRWMYLKKGESINNSPIPEEELLIDSEDKYHNIDKTKVKDEVKTEVKEEIVKETEWLPFVKKSEDDGITVDWTIPKKEEVKTNIEVDESIMFG